jgi:cytochrome b pre-mRNA-processing protein 3
MISLPFRRPSRNSTIDGLYGTIVAQARSPVFYRSYGVPDTVSARADMIVLHLVLVLRRLREAQASLPSENALGQQLFDRFCEDMDDNFREMGVGDLAVPKAMRRVGEAFYGRARSYEAALAAGDVDSLATALARNVFDAAGTPKRPLGARRLAAYIFQATHRLGVLPAEALVRAKVDFPDPEAVSGSNSQRVFDEQASPAAAALESANRRH